MTTTSTRSVEGASTSASFGHAAFEQPGIGHAAFGQPGSGTVAFLLANANAARIAYELVHGKYDHTFARNRYLN